MRTFCKLRFLKKSVRMKRKRQRRGGLFLSRILIFLVEGIKFSCAQWINIAIYVKRSHSTVICSIVPVYYAPGVAVIQCKSHLMQVASSFLFAKAPMPPKMLEHTAP